MAAHAHATYRAQTQILEPVMEKTEPSGPGIIGGRTANPEGFHRKVLLYPTLRCPIQCRHCAIKSDPNRKEEMSQEVLETFLGDVVDCGKVEIVVFSGGEPFLVRKKIGKPISFLCAKGLAVSVQTSAYWAESPAKAIRVLSSLPGISQLVVSVDEFHQEFVPFQNVANACTACAELGIDIRIHTLAYESERVETQLKERIPASVASKISVYRNQAIHLVGRGHNLRDHPNIVRQDVFPERVCFSCSVAFLLPDGTVTACGGDMQWNGKGCDFFELGVLGKNSFSEITSAAEKNYLVHAMRLWGPKRLAEIAIARGVAANLGSTYIRDDICDLCCDLFSNPEIVDVIKKELDKAGFRREIALARAFFLGELEML